MTDLFTIARTLCTDDRVHVSALIADADARFAETLLAEPSTYAPTHRAPKHVAVAS